LLRRLGLVSDLTVEVEDGRPSGKQVRRRVVRRDAYIRTPAYIVPDSDQPATRGRTG